jgi:hypothetical protein
MKKILSIFILIGFVILNACDPMEDIYDELDAAEKPINAEISFTLTADDYADASEYAIDDAVTPEDTSYAESVEDMEAFNKMYTAEEYIPYILGDKYIVLDSASVAVVTYNVYLGLDYLDNVGSPDDAYTLITADYDAMGTGEDEPGEFNSFSSGTPPEDFLPAYMLTLYPDAEEGEMVIITYDYYSGSTNAVEGYLYFDGVAWMMLSNTYELVDADYDAMGAPGQYNNFSSSAKPEDYLPTWLKLAHPYDVAGTVRTIIYLYYSGSANTYAQEYRYDGNSWTQYDAMTVETNQFIHNGTEWVFDPAETIEMTTADYQIIVDYVKANLADKDPSTYDDSENYYGASAHYNNFDGRSGKWNSTDFATWDDAVKEAIGEIFLPAKYPNAVAVVNGAQMGYNVVFDSYTGSYATYVIRFNVSKAGPDPEFEYVTGPILQ